MKSAEQTVFEPASFGGYVVFGKPVTDAYREYVGDLDYRSEYEVVCDFFSGLDRVAIEQYATISNVATQPPHQEMMELHIFGFDPIGYALELAVEVTKADPEGKYLAARQPAIERIGALATWFRLWTSVKRPPELELIHPDYNIPDSADWFWQPCRYPNKWCEAAAVEEPTAKIEQYTSYLKDPGSHPELRQQLVRYIAEYRQDS